MDLAVNIAIGLAAQIALFVAPLLVLVSFVLGPNPMALVFNGFELGAVFLAILIANHVTHDGESTWYEGVQLLPSTRCSGSSSSSHNGVRRAGRGLWGGGERPPEGGWWRWRARHRPLVLLASTRSSSRGRDASFPTASSGGWAGSRSGCWSPGSCSALNGSEDGVSYPTVYLIERTLSLDNLFVFLLLFAYFGVPHAPPRAPVVLGHHRQALVLRGLAILGGTALIEQFHVVLYLLGVLLLVLAYRIYRGVGEDVDPDQQHRRARRCAASSRSPTGSARGTGSSREDGKRHVTPIFLCLAAIVAADIAFAVDSIPAAFAITTDPLIIWAGNVFALLGLRALFVLVEGLIKRFRYLDETIAVVLGLVAVKILIEPLVKIGPVASLGARRGRLRRSASRLSLHRRPPRSRGRGAAPRGTGRGPVSHR